ncbi:MAG: aminotransferase class I/II-fold pyridoxal phosphate-dependent enzyme [Gemmataceae bacterium]|nr:aminotransferase class I/II-fold pyridoxal phosphate-dependent enzyme [Gemmataceae bacterium]
MADAIIDLRSDTVTRPTPAMRAAMAAAEVGDDVFDDDPTVHRLQERVADLLGKEAGLFVPSGTMSNQIAVKLHAGPGDELLMDADCHIYNYEVGAPAALSGVTCRCIEGTYGIIDAAQLEGKCRPINEHLVVTKAVCLENTHNRGGGKVYPLDKIAAIHRWARQHQLGMHLDGARLWNAIVATGTPAREWAKYFDTVSVCFSKGLGAPVGSLLAGPKDWIAKARRIRKMLGGGMRQAGVLAAAALYALDHHLDRLADDHRRARLIAAAIRDTPGLTLDPPEVETNLIWFNIGPELGTSFDVAAVLQRHGILIHTSGPRRARACTHLDVSQAQAERVADVIRTALKPRSVGQVV